MLLVQFYNFFEKKGAFFCLKICTIKKNYLLLQRNSQEGYAIRFNSSVG